MATDRNKGLSPILIFGLPIFYVTSLGFIGEILFFLDVNENAINALIFPFLEESFKFFIARRFPSAVFRVIVIFGICEVIFAKGPIILEYTAGTLVVPVIFVLTAFNLHLATAFAYGGKCFTFKPILLFFAMIVIHSFYNYLDNFDLRVIYLVAASAVISALPYLWLVRGGVFRPSPEVIK